MQTDLILIHGRRGSGKSTLSGFLRLLIRKAACCEKNWNCEEIKTYPGMNLVPIVFDIKEQHRVRGTRRLTIIVPDTPVKFVDSWPGHSLKVMLCCEEHLRQERGSHRPDFTQFKTPSTTIDSSHLFDMVLDSSHTGAPVLAAKILSNPYLSR